jgi:hypothetical protein
MATNDLTRSELRAIRSHYRRRVYLAFLVPAVIAAALGWVLLQGRSSQARPRPAQAAPTTAPVTTQPIKEVASRACLAAVKQASKTVDQAAKALKDWRAHANAMTDYRAGNISLTEARRRWAETTKVGLAGADRFDRQARSYAKTATGCR